MVVYLGNGPAPALVGMSQISNKAVIRSNVKGRSLCLTGYPDKFDIQGLISGRIYGQGFPIW